MWFRRDIQYFKTISRGNKMIEEWRPVKEWPDRYEISNYGNIRDRKQECSNGLVYHFKSAVLKTHLHRTGYYRVRLCVNRQKFSRSIHRLVAEAFIWFYFSKSSSLIVSW